MKKQKVLFSIDKENVKTYFLLLYTSLYILTALATYAVPMREISFFGIHTYGSALILPAWYILGDAIAELFGIRISRYLIWMSILVCFLYALAVMSILQLPHPNGWTYEKDFDYVFSPMLKGVVLCSVAAIIGGYINSYLISRWKILIKGRYFLLRSIGASIVGEFFHVVVASVIIFSAVLPLRQMIFAIIITYFIHIIFSIIYSIPSSILVLVAKKYVRSELTSYNPFNDKTT